MKRSALEILAVKAEWVREGPVTKQRGEKTEKRPIPAQRETFVRGESTEGPPNPRPQPPSPKTAVRGETVRTHVRGETTR